MTEKNKIWNDKQVELQSLALEISDLKIILREVSQQIARIDRRVRVVLPNPSKPAKKSPPKSLESERAQTIVTRLTDRARAGEQIEDELRRMSVKNELSVLAREFGMTNTKLPPKNELVNRISTRIRQRASVQTGIYKGAKADSEIHA